MKIKKFTLIICLALLLIFAGTDPAMAASQQNPGLALQVKSAIAIDQQSGQILYAKNVQQGMPIASLTKLMTAYLTLQAIKAGRLKWSQTVVPPAAAVENTQKGDFTNVPLMTGHRYTIRQLYQATLIESANGAAMTLAQAVAGKQSAFIDQMNALARRWQLSQTHFYTSCGLSNNEVGNLAYPGAGSKAENKASAQAVALISQHLLTDFPEVLRTTSVHQLNFVDGRQKTLMINWNRMVPGGLYASRKFKVDGLKTGTTVGAGACFAATTKIHQRRVITVVLGAKNDQARFRQTEKLLNYLQSHYAIVDLSETKLLAKTKQGHHYRVKIANIRQVWDPLDGQYLRLHLPAVNEPIFKGENVGTGQLQSGQQVLSSVQDLHPLSVKVTSCRQVGQKNLWEQVRELWQKLLNVL